MKNNNRLNNKGFSLMELLVTLAISGFVILAALSLVLVGTKNYDNNNQNASVQKEASFTTNILGENVRDADEISMICNIKKADGSVSNDIHLYTQDRTIRYYDDQNMLCIMNSAYDTLVSMGKTEVISKYVEDFKVKMIKNDASEIDVASLGTEDVIFTTDKEDNHYKKYIADPLNNDPVTLDEDVTAVKFEITFKYGDKTDTTTVIYNMRNTN